MALSKITTNSLAANAVTSAAIANGEIALVDLASNSVGSNQIAAGAVTSEKLASTLSVSELEVNGTIDIQQVIETANISAIVIGGNGTSAGNTTFDILDGAVKYHTANVANNWTLNVRGNSTVMLDSVMSTGNVMTLSYVITQLGANTFYQTNMQIDGNGVIPYWQGGTTPSAGNATSLDVYSFTIIKTASNTYTVLGSQTRFAQ